MGSKNTTTFNERKILGSIVKGVKTMSKIYGYCRISTSKQSIERQITNIRAAYPSADIRTEAYTGTKIEGREELLKILKKVKAGDTIVFDSVSRMSRDADEGVQLYFELYNKGVNLVFLKEAYINTDTYKSTLNNKIQLTGDDVDLILEGVNKYLIRLADKQIRIAFEQSEKEVQDLKTRTAEGLREKREQGKDICGTVNKGKTYHTKKSDRAKELILKHSKSFGGTLNNAELMQLTGITEPTLLKYKKEIKLNLTAKTPCGHDVIISGVNAKVFSFNE